MTSGVVKDLANVALVDFVPCDISFLEGNSICGDLVDCMSSCFPLHIIEQGQQCVDIAGNDTEKILRFQKEHIIAPMMVVACLT